MTQILYGTVVYVDGLISSSSPELSFCDYLLRHLVCLSLYSVDIVDLCS